MLTTLNRLVGLPVVRQGKEIGLVERAVPDEAARRLHGIVVRRGLGAARWLPPEAILWLGEKCIVAQKEPCLLPGDLPRPASLVYLTSGRLLGQVSDHILQGTSLRIVALEVCAGPLYRLAGKSSYATDYQVQGETGQVMVGQLLSWAQMNRMPEEERE